MLRTSLILGALLTARVFLPGGQVAAQEGVRRPDPEVPDFLKPAPRELLRRGLQPLSAELPDTDPRDGLLPPDASEGLFGEAWHDLLAALRQGGADAVRKAADRVLGFGATSGADALSGFLAVSLQKKGAGT